MITDDDVYLSLEEARQEYILEDTGLIWRGSHNSMRPSPWTYGQFETDILECVLYLLSKHLKPGFRGDCIKTVRILAALVRLKALPILVAVHVEKASIHDLLMTGEFKR